MENKPKIRIDKPVKKGYFETLVDDGVDKFMLKWYEEDIRPGIKGFAYSICVSLLNTVHNTCLSGINKVFDMKGTPTTNYNMLGNSFTNYSNSNRINNVAPLSTSFFNTTVAGQKPKIDANLPIGEIVFTNRKDADYVLYNMMQCYNQYGMVGLDYFYELAGYDIEPGVNCNIANLGWTNLNNASVIKNGNGYSLNLPLYKRIH